MENGFRNVNWRNRREPHREPPRAGRRPPPHKQQLQKTFFSIVSSAFASWTSAISFFGSSSGVPVRAGTGSVGTCRPQSYTQTSAGERTWGNQSPKVRSPRTECASLATPPFRGVLGFVRRFTLPAARAERYFFDDEHSSMRIRVELPFGMAQVEVPRTPAWTPLRNQENAPLIHRRMLRALHLLAPFFFHEETWTAHDHANYDSSRTRKRHWLGLWRKRTLERRCVPGGELTST